MIFVFAFILLWTFSVATRDTINMTEVRLKSLKMQGRYLLYRSPDIARAPKPKLSPRSLPKKFDARKKWTKCGRIFDHIGNQGNCGSCWAVTAAAMISQVHCIQTDGAVQFTYSAQDIMSCAESPNNNGCYGGYPEDAFKYWITHGVPSGGDIDSNEGCLPYSEEAFLRWVDVGCAEECSNPDYPVPYEEDKKFGHNFRCEELDTMSNIQHSIMTYGPVFATFDSYDDFSYYDGSYVYRYSSGNESYPHAVLLFGWGVENGIPYWLGQNSYGRNWGIQGIFKFLRGQNHLNIERKPLRLISNEQEEKEKTKKPWDWRKHAGRLNKDPNPRGHVISKEKKINPVLSILLLNSIFVSANCHNGF